MWRTIAWAPVAAFRGHTSRSVVQDLVAGLTVAAVELPQSIAYALLAGVPPVYGIYASLIQGLLAGLMTGTRFVSVGATNTMALLVASATTRFHSPEGSDASGELFLQIICTLAIIKGVVQMFLAAARVGDLAKYVSRSVIVGVTTGAGLLILANQVAPFLGVRAPRVEDEWPGVIGVGQRLWGHVGEINLTAVALGSLTVVVIICCRRISKLLPGAMLAIVMFAAVVWRGDLVNGEGVAVVGALPQGLPMLSWPSLSPMLLRELIAPGVAMALLGAIEMVAVAKSIGAPVHGRIDPNREIFAQGFAGTVSGFLSGMPGSVSFTRTALGISAGAQSRLACLFASMAMAAGLFLLAAPAAYIPQAALAGALVVISIKLVEVRYFWRVYKSSRGDAMVFVATVVATLVMPLEFAIFTGIFLNLALYLQTAAKLHLSEMTQTDTGQFIERPVTDRSGNKAVMFLQAEGDLFFGIADDLRQRLAVLGKGEARVIILRLKRTHSIDATVLEVLEEFAKDMRRNGRHLILCGLRTELMSSIRSYGLVKLLGRENVFEAGSGVFTSARQALNRARQLVRSSLDDDFLRAEEKQEVNYEI